MMKKLILFFSILITPMLGYCQIPSVSIQDIQGWSGQFQPDSCTDGPNPTYLNQVVKVRGVVITPGGLNETAGQTRWIWIRDVTATPSTPFGNITVRANAATTPVDLNTVVPGDTIEVIGTVTEFLGSSGANNGETQLTPVDNGVQLISFDPGPAPQPLPVSVGQLNGNLNSDGQPGNHITTGEPLEGNFVEISNVTVVNVTLTGDRCRLLVKDANENHIWIYDRFKTQRLSNGFVPPNVGDQYTSIRGVIEGWKNGCGNTAATNRGYNLNPFSLTHYTKGASSPAIGNIRKSTPCPSASSPLTVSAEITDDSLVTSAEVLYSIDGTNYTAVPANPLGVRYSAQIPAQPNGTLVRYYLRAKDNVNNTTVLPNVPGQTPALFYIVNNSGCVIKDMQFTPYPVGRSGYVGDTVTLQGIVTASADASNLGYVYIQQENQTEWGGIWVNGGSLITNLTVGDEVSVTGIIEEYFGLTRLSNISNASIIQTGQTVPTPVSLNPSILSTYDFAICEKYESVLVSLQNPLGNLFVVDTNADAGALRNNGEWRIGGDVNDATSGCRVLTGRQGSTTFSSLNVSYVNSPIWATTDGTMNVPVIVVQMGQEITSAQGILTYSFSNMKLLPRNNSDISTPANVQPFNKLALKVYPNPVKDRLQIQNLTNQKMNYELINSLGQVVKSGTLNQDVNNLDVSLTNGIYYIVIKDTSGLPKDRLRISIN
jgi:hypothetical protein